MGASWSEGWGFPSAIVTVAAAAEEGVFDEFSPSREEFVLGDEADDGFGSVGVASSGGAGP
ncbi:hypothetical protein, partial [Microbacterium sp.]|uniref:hypothetical protein n=1 Tax=Microbacterium sp. TaxID=51671 RepID=UPI0039E23F62